MRAVALLLALLSLTACSAMPGGSDPDFMAQFDRQHQRVVRDVDAIMQGMLRARAQSERLATQNP